MSSFATGLTQTLACIAFVTGACLSAGWMTMAHEYDRMSQAREEVAVGFEQAYGLQLDDRDVAALKQIEEYDITRNLKSSDGLLKQVMFRVVDDNVLPHTLDGAGTWIPMTSHQITR